MPNVIDKGPPHTLAASRVRRWLYALAGYAERPPTTLDAGTAQRAAIGRLHLANMDVPAVAQEPAAHPAGNYSGETNPLQIIVPRPGLDQADPVAGVSTAGAGIPPILPSARRTLPVT